MNALSGGGVRSLYDTGKLSRRKMPTLTNVVKDSIKNAIQAREPSRTKSGDYLLKFGNARNSGYRFLVKGGVATPAGEFWRDQTGQALPVECFAVDAPLERMGRTDYIETTKGQQAVRSWILLGTSLNILLLVGSITGTDALSGLQTSQY